MSDNVNSVDADFIPDEILLEAKSTLNDVLPSKSLARYEQAYQDFLLWQKEKNTSSLDEKVMLAYFKGMASKYSSATLWSQFSMLKCLLSSRHSVDLENYNQLQAFLKAKHKNYTAKKAKIFEKEDLKKFLSEAADEQ